MNLINHGIPWNKGLRYGKQISICIDCGKRKGRTYNKKCRRCAHLGRANPSTSGCKNNNWKGGIASTNKIERQKFRDQLQKFIFERDNYTCKMCGIRGGILQVDHILPWSEFKELRFSINNCRTLCMNCHYRITYGKELPERAKVWGQNLKHLERGVN